MVDPFDDDALIDQLLDATADERERLLADLEQQDPLGAAQARRWLHFALDDKGMPQSLGGDFDALLDAFNASEPQDVEGRHIGPYRIATFLRRGGMGMVYKAHRDDGQFEQTVAIKLLPRSLSTPQRKRLFERERQFLGRLEHPNIARIIDAGIADDGLPYLVMEFVDGRRLQNALAGQGRNERLRLFEQLCDAVSFCHGNFLVHGDLKPSNVMVADGRVRLLDFGVARLVQDDEDTFTQAVGITPGFAAPELRSGAAATICSDVYSLGKLLASIMVGLKSDPELTSIINRASAHDPQQRYPSVESFQRDVKARRLSFPVSAHAQTASYRFTSFVRRNAVSVGLLSATFLLLVAALWLALLQNERAKQEAAKANAVSEFVTAIFDRERIRNFEEQLTLLDVMDAAAERAETELSDAPEVQAEVRQLIASGYFGLGEYERSLELQEAATQYYRENHPSPDRRLVQANNRLGIEYVRNGRAVEAVALYQDSISQLEAMDMDESRLAGSSWDLLGTAYGYVDVDQSIAAKMRALDIYRKIYAPEHPRIASTLVGLGNNLRHAGRHEEAIQYRREGIALAASQGVDDRPAFLTALCNIALDESSLGQHAKAMQAHGECLEKRRKLLGDDHPEHASTYNNMGSLALTLGDLDRAKIYLGRARSLAAQSLPEASLPRLATDMNYATYLWHSGQARDAIPIMRNVVEKMEAALGPASPASMRSRSILGRIQLAAGNISAAQALSEPDFDDNNEVWKADGLLWAAETALAAGDLSRARQLASEASAIRARLPAYSTWQRAEAEYVAALAGKDEAQVARVSRSFADLPSGHYRAKQ